ncbi:AfsR/SARP family transcriptional regulator [Phytomonospora endophytica]|uniref:DNA-binding SARP family transcriptional activator n=1 Tax=Phytomonospora endophytica TaxID=714109 RepID=A0A841FAZ3_9ACTN|nr:AfsR/SARP family transcriptional regulator [Phytomonospora endophytica]MBB6032203.1 DNA-binding SARP family transcriptional activator [Phytomonospora endophytica]GIG68552.1 SARP family transcriptional regulator [Phytomonospora endophytica]
MEFRILGPLEVLRDGRSVPLGGPRQRTVLAALLLHANKPLTPERLIELCWEDPPSSAEANLRKFIWQLRKALHDGADPEPRIVREHGFRIVVRPGELDLWHFTELSNGARKSWEAGNTLEAAGEFARALAVSSPEPLGGVRLESDLEWLRAELRERRENVEEQYFRLRLELGEHIELIGELRSLLARQPLREHVAALLMLALYRAGRQDKALAVFRDTRERLVDELGVEPGPELRELHQRILRADTGLGRATVNAAPASGSAAAQLPMGITAFSGRAEALAELGAVLDRGASLCAISGTAGVGKTALAVHWARSVRERFPDGQLYVNLRGFDPEKTPMDPAEALGGFLDALGVPPARVPAGLAAQSALYRSLLADRRVLVVLDNARDAEQIRPLLPAAAGGFAVVTSRTQLTGLIAAGTAHPMNLDVLTRAEAADLLAVRLGRPRVGERPEAVDRIIERCARLPLALAIVAARAAVQPAFGLDVLADELDASAGVLDAFDSRDPGTDLRSTFSWSFHALGTHAARLFRLLGLHAGPDISVHAAASLAGVSPQRARRLLAELDQARMLDEHVPGRYAFHDLLRAYACELAYCCGHREEREEALRRLMDHYLHTANRAAGLLDPNRESIALGERAPGVLVEAHATHDEAVTWFRAEHRVLLSAIESAFKCGLDAHAWQLTWAMSPFLRRKGMGREWIAALRTALRATARSRDLTGRATTHYLMAVAQFRHGSRTESAEHVALALDRYRELHDHYGQACCRFLLCWRHEEEGDWEAALRAADEVLALYRLAGHRAGEGRALASLAWYRARLGDHRRALDECLSALAVLREVRDPGGQASTWDTIGYVHHALADYDLAIGAYRNSVRLYRELDDRFNVVTPLVRLGDTYRDTGATEATRRVWRQALAVLVELGNPQADEVRGKLARL